MKNLLKYKEYLGTVSFSNEDQCLYGKVIGIDDLVSYESDSVSGLKKPFETQPGSQYGLGPIPRK